MCYPFSPFPLACFTAGAEDGCQTPPCNPRLHHYDAPLPQDDPESPSYNLPERLSAFLAACSSWEAAIGAGTTRDILFMMGTDFTYADANVWYTNMDKLIHYAVSARARTFALSRLRSR